MRTQSISPICNSTRSINSPAYDLIGDIHGHLSELEALLRKLGYEQKEKPERGGPKAAYQHPEGRRVIFLGDFIDRGPAIRETLFLVRSMVESGSALAVMGNHELNAIAFHTPDGSGDFLRPHILKNTAQISATLAAFTDREAEWQEWLRWFANLPLFLDLGSLRVVHACWDARVIEALGGSNRFEPSLITPPGAAPSASQQALSTLLKGPEIPLPRGVALCSTAPEGDARREMRVCWWSNQRPLTYRKAALSLPFALPEEPLTPEEMERVCGYPPEAPPVFFGHYGYLKPPEPLAPNVACLDLGVIRGGALCAYRFDGERELSREKFVWVAASEAKKPMEGAGEKGAEGGCRMSYKVLVDDNARYMDQEARYSLGELTSLEVAMTACRRMVDEFLLSSYQPGMSAEEVFGLYSMFGEDPWVAPALSAAAQSARASSPGEPAAAAQRESPPPFSAWDYARERAEEICRNPAA